MEERTHKRCSVTSNSFAEHQTLNSSTLNYLALHEIFDVEANRRACFDQEYQF